MTECLLFVSCEGTNCDVRRDSPTRLHLLLLACLCANARSECAGCSVLFTATFVCLFVCVCVCLSVCRCLCWIVEHCIAAIQVRR